MTSQSVVFVRHGQSLGNVAGAFLGNDAINFLTPVGVNQALAVKLPDGMEFSRFHASLNTRAHHTLMMMMLTLKQRWHLDHIILSDALNEALVSETGEGVRARSVRAIEQISRSLESGGNVLVVSHNWIMSDIFKVLKLNLPEDAIDRTDNFEQPGSFYNNYIIKHCYPIAVPRHVFDAVSAATA